MKIKKVITYIFCISLIILVTGCIGGEYTQELEITPDTGYTEPQYSQEMQQLIDFLKADKVNEDSYYQDPHRGVDYYVCTGYSRDLAQNAKEYNIDMGAIAIRDTMSVGIGTRYNHAMNYCIIDEKFILVEPQTDEIYTFSTSLIFTPIFFNPGQPKHLYRLPAPPHGLKTTKLHLYSKN